MTSTPTVSKPIVAKFETVENIMNGVLYERNKEIRTSLVALIAGKHHLTVGPPGTGKTLTVDTLSRLISGVEGNYFRYLMTRFTTPEEIFGPPSLRALQEEDIYRRNTQRKLPEARIAFLDELFKANSSILNAMLTILNEGLFFNGPDVIDVDLNTLFAASNELPREPELAALWDRITFRHEVQPMKETVNRRKMLIARALRSQVVLEPVLSWDELQVARTEATNVIIPEGVIDKVVELQEALKKEGVEPTDRRISDGIGVIQATAWLDGRGIADVEDLRLLRHVLWIDIKDQPIVNQAVLAIASPLDKDALEALELVDKLAAKATELLKTDGNDQKRKTQGVEIHQQLERVSNDLEEMEKKAIAGGKKCELIQEGKQRVATVAKTLLKELFNLNT